MTTPAALEARDQDFTVTRVFDAPRALVWKAWTEAERLAQWWGPKGATIRVITLDVRPGGIFHYAMQYRPGHDIYGRFVYQEIAAPERLVFVSSFADANGNVARAPFPGLEKFPLAVRNVVILTEQGGKTTLNLRGGPIEPSEEERRTYVGMVDSMRQGFGGTFDQLAAYLAKS